MASPELLIQFVLATIVFAILPGPALIYATGQTLANGRKGGFLAAVGLHVGGCVHILAATFGLSALLALIPAAYFVLKLVGAFYLIWIGINMFRAKNEPAETRVVQKKSNRRAFLDSFTVEVLNPKTALFFLAFLPQFVDPAGAFPIWLQFLILGFVTNLFLSSADIVAVFFTSAIVKQFKKSGPVQKLAQRVAGSLMIFLGLRLALSEDLS